MDEPYKASFVVVGDLCVFRLTSETKPIFRVGKILQFIQFTKEKTKTYPYKGNYADVSGNLGVICTWYEKKEKTEIYMMCKSNTTYVPTNLYVCTLTKQ